MPGSSASRGIAPRVNLRRSRQGSGQHAALLKTGDLDGPDLILAVLSLLGSVLTYALLRVYHKEHSY